MLNGETERQTALIVLTRQYLRLSAPLTVDSVGAQALPMNERILRPMEMVKSFESL